MSTVFAVRSIEEKLKLEYFFILLFAMTTSSITVVFVD